MADIELVIKINEDTYHRIQALVRDDYFEHDICGYSMQRIADGTPLPKGHGRLIDVDILEYTCNSDECITIKGCNHCQYSIITEEEIDNAPTIIEADKEYEVEVITRGNCMMCGKELTEGLFFCKECEEKANSRK